jgi:hypothetical protein
MHRRQDPTLTIRPSVFVLWFAFVLTAALLLLSAA